MKSIEKVAKTIDEAITEALIDLGASTDQVEIEIISKGSKGLLGFGAKAAKVRVTLKEDPMNEQIYKSSIDLDLLNLKDELSNSKDEPISTSLEEETVSECKDSEDKVVVSKQEIDTVIKNAEVFLEKLLKQMDMECTVHSSIINNNRINICLEGKNMGIIIGKRGETLDALQYLVNIVANKQRTEYIKIMIDTENYRSRREETLKKLAIKLSKKVEKSKKPIILEPMNPYDRRVIHSTLQTSKSVKTHSEGKEPYRKVVITPSYHNNKTYK